MKLEKFDARISGIASVDYRYVFNGTEKRTLGIYSHAEKEDVMSAQYRQMMKNETAGVFPAANILVHNVSVTPGHQIEGLVGIAAEWKGFTFDVGYNLYWSEQEHLTLPATLSWSNDTYALAHQQYSLASVTTQTGTTAVGQAGNHVAEHLNKIGGGLLQIQNDGDTGAAQGTDIPEPGHVSFWGPVQQNSSSDTKLLRKKYAANATPANAPGNPNTDGTALQTVAFHLSTLPAQTPAQTIHSVVAGAGYKFTGKYPVIVGLGGKVDFADSQKTTPENWSVWAKAGLCF